MSVEIRRAFADTSIGQMHYRRAGDGPILLLLHASPGSSKQLEPLIQRLATSCTVIAPDTPGNGDSPALPLEAPDIADYTALILELMDALEIKQASVYGSHTGACLASELALLAPDRIERVIQDGAVIFNPEERRELIKRYAHPFEPDLNGTHLIRAFMFCRDQFLFFPWYATDKQHLRDTGLPEDPQPLHEWVLEVLKGATTYHLAYRAAFAYPTEERLPLVQQPVLCIASANDPLEPGTREIASQLSNGRYQELPRFDDPGYADSLAATISGFVLG
jgi:pimeloyl-ACP methyl ester carboxylesterase